MAPKKIISLLDDGLINEKFWKKIKFLIPQKDHSKKVGRPRCDDKIIMSGHYLYIGDRMSAEKPASLLRI